MKETQDIILHYAYQFMNLLLGFEYRCKITCRTVTINISKFMFYVNCLHLNVL